MRLVVCAVGLRDQMAAGGRQAQAGFRMFISTARNARSSVSLGGRAVYRGRSPAVFMTSGIRVIRAERSAPVFVDWGEGAAPLLLGKVIDVVLHLRAEGMRKWQTLPSRAL
jgi:hypothetical protein